MPSFSCILDYDVKSSFVKNCGASVTSDLNLIFTCISYVNNLKSLF